MKKNEYLTLDLIGLSYFSELNTAPGGGTHTDGEAGLHGALDWRLLSGEWIQPPPAGVQSAVWELDRCPTHRHATYRFGGGLTTSNIK